MRVLIIAMAESIHTARWIYQIADQGWELHLFPSIDLGEGHREIRNVTIHHSFYASGKNPPGIKVRGIPLVDENVSYAFRKAVEKLFPNYRAHQLARLIQRLRPDIVHTLEMQHAGYLVLNAMKYLKCELPPWIVTCWGSDIYLFGRLDEHVARIENVLSNCGFFSSDCKRDYDLAVSNGFRGKFLPSIPGGGGFDLEKCEQLRSPGPVSQRRIVMVKGHQGWSGRALVSLRALVRCADVLHGYQVMVYSAQTEDVQISIQLMRKESGIQVETVPLGTSHEMMLALHGQARISIGLGVSDGTPNSMLEAMVMGAFPIQSWTACADEWMEDGITGLLVSPDDPDVVEYALRRALTDDDLVNRAAVLNWQVAEKRLDHSNLAKQTIDLYTTVARKN